MKTPHLNRFLNFYALCFRYEHANFDDTSIEGKAFFAEKTSFSGLKCQIACRLRPRTNQIQIVAGKTKPGFAGLTTECALSPHMQEEITRFCNIIEILGSI